MVTITDLTDDDDRLLELFMLLDRRDQGLLMRQAAISACYAAAVRGKAVGQEALREAATPESTTVKTLRQCAPELPYGWHANLDTGFEDQVSRCVFSRLGERALDMILTTSEHDEGNARILAEWAHEFADQFGPDYCAPRFDEGYVEAASMQRFIEEWRDSFMANLRRAYSRLSEPHEPQPTPWQ